MISDLWKTDEYYRNLASIREAFPGKRYLTQKDMREYLGVGDNRALRTLDINGRLTAESLALRLVKGQRR